MTKRRSRSSCRLTLESSGITWKAHSTPRKRLRPSERIHTRFQLLVADLTLPDLPGQDMAVQMLAQNPNLRILLCSGYPFAVDSLPVAIQNRFASLQKPFLPNMLASAIEELLGRKIE